MSDPFKLDLKNSLRERKKPDAEIEVAHVDAAGDRMGFVSREPAADQPDDTPRKRGRPSVARTADQKRTTFALPRDVAKSYKMWLAERDMTLQDHLEEFITKLVQK